MSRLVPPAVAILAVSLFASVAGAAPLTVSATPSAVAPGDSVVVRYAVKRTPARLAVLLDGRHLATARVRQARGRTAVTVPRDASPGAHRLTACVAKACRSVALSVARRTASAGELPVPEQPTGGVVGQAPPPGPSAAPVDFGGPADPLAVEAHTDASQGASATIDTDGGTLETTGADGTHYRLVVPEGALLSPERISMTPIDAVDGMPFSGGLVAGVQLEPSGLRFSDYVTVEISGHPPVTPQRETGFLYQRDGVEFQLYPVEEGPTKTTFRIIHFSGVGIADGTQAERNAQLLRRTTDVEGRFAAQLSTYFRPGEPIDMDGVKATLRAYHDQVLRPLMVAATTDDGLALQAIQRYVPWARMIALLIADEEDFMTAERQTRFEEWLDIFVNAARKARERCIDQNRPEELAAILSWWRLLGLLGLEDKLPAETISSCARFELDFHTKVVQKHLGNVEGPEVWTGEAIAENVIIEPDPTTLEQRGAKDAQYVDFEVTIPPHKPGTGCWHGGGEWESTFPFRVSRLMIDINPVQRPDGTYGYSEFERGKIALSVVPFVTREQILTVDCNGTGAPAWSMWLAPTFLELHEDQLNDVGGMVFTDWTVPDGGGSMLGAKSYFRTVTLGGQATREETTLELYHAPIR